jgi:oligopeptidase B
MRATLAIHLLVVIILLTSNFGDARGQRTADDGREPSAPQARIEPKVFEEHGYTRVDNYYWMRDRESEEVIEYLNEENAYLERELAHIQPLRDTIFEEIKGRIKQEDESVPYRQGDYFYYDRYKEGLEYPIYARKRGSLEAEEEILIDANERAEGQDYYSLATLEPSPDGRFIAFAEDTVGRRIYSIRFLDTETGEVLEDRMVGTGYVAWANDNKTVFYAKQDLETLRPDRIYRHVLGTQESEDQLVFHEDDVTFYTAVGKSRSGRFIIVASGQTVSTEYRVLEADDPLGEFVVIQPRERNHEYSVTHHGDEFLIRTNLDAKNFRLMRAPLDAPGKDNWEEVIPHREDVLLGSVDAFRDFVVVTERKDGLTRLQVRPVDGSEPHFVEFGEPAYWAYVGTNMVFDTDILRYNYTSMTTPMSVFDYDMRTRERELKKETEVLGGFDKNNYITDRLYATGRDGTRIPISIVYHRAHEPGPSTPLLLFGYGSYGISEDPYFSASRISLLDRGMTFAVAHVRGGEEMGRYWYEDGKLLKKKNTFYDFIDCAEYLIESGLADSSRVYAMGGSAGGLLVGAVINLRPDLFDGAVAAVPFVDVVTTMLDESIPLTTGEYDEWGNPNDKEYYDYILSYSPYDNVEAKDYPALLVTSGLHDSQVQYWEPTKWVAKLRATKTDAEPVVLYTNMDAGHSGQSGRFRRYWETALEYGFLLDQAGRKAK